jgi:acetylornithine deacetylase/succinyl-diaminopimelate desuccinylase-like protein
VELARDLVAVAELELGGEHPTLGAPTLQPTVVRAGTARNVVPAEASAVLDVRTVPGAHRELVARVQRAVRGEVKVLSERPEPRETASDEAIARRAPGAAGGAGLWLRHHVGYGVPARRAGDQVRPGQERALAHPDEFVLEEEILQGAAFLRCPRGLRHLGDTGSPHATTLG